MVGFETHSMRVDQDLLFSVAFLSTGMMDELIHQATSFVLIHRGCRYLVTAKHVAQQLADNPFFIRFNQSGGGSGLLPIDFAMGGEELFRWFCHPLASVDLAVLPFPVDIKSQGMVAVDLNSSAAVPRASPMSEAGCGDMCHVIGLFTPLPGKSRNIPVVHTGHIAAMSDSRELVAVNVGGQTTDLEGYLVEISNMSGLSGAPVFVRGGVELEVPIDDLNKIVVTAHKPDLKLLGVWAGSWDKPTSRANERVPTGIGIVTPAYRLLELLEFPDVDENRRQWVRKLSAAQAD